MVKRKSMEEETAQKLIKEKIDRAIKKFNKYRSPEATAEMLSFLGDVFEVEFSGPFCQSCGFYDYFDDFKAALEEVGLSVEVKNVEETGEGAIVEFELL